MKSKVFVCFWFSKCVCIFLNICAFSVIFYQNVFIPKFFSFQLFSTKIDQNKPLQHTRCPNSKPEASDSSKQDIIKVKVKENMHIYNYCRMWRALVRSSEVRLQRNARIQAMKINYEKFHFYWHTSCGGTSRACEVPERIGPRAESRDICFMQSGHCSDKNLISLNRVIENW